MAEKRKTPLFLIDRQKPVDYPYDYIYADDGDVPFIAKVMYYPTEDTFNTAQFDEKTMYREKLHKGGVILKIEKFTKGSPSDNNAQKRVNTLLKKALKKYLNTASKEFIKSKELCLDNQIYFMKTQIEHNTKIFSKLVQQEGGNVAFIQSQLDLLEATLASLQKLKLQEDGR